MLAKNMRKAKVLNALLTSVFTGNPSLQEFQASQTRESWDQSRVITDGGQSG